MTTTPTEGDPPQLYGTEGMTPAEIVAAREAGQFDHWMRGGTAPRRTVSDAVRDAIDGVEP